MYPTEDKPQFGVYVKNQVELLKKNGYEFAIISIPTKGNKYLRYFKFFIRSLFYILIKGKSYDIVHAHYAFPPGLFALIHKSLYESKMIVTCHGSDIYKMPNKNKFVDWGIRKVMNKSDVIICVSKGLKSEIKARYKVDTNKIKVINMGVDTTIFNKQNKELTRSQLNLHNNTSIILYVGNFYKAKGVIDLISAFKSIDNTDKLLILVGDSTVDKDVENYIRANIINNILIVGSQPQDIIAQYMNAADVFVLPSYSEGFNLVTLEAMASEILLVVSDIKAFDYLDEDMAIKIKAGDVEDISNAIIKALSLSDPFKYIEKCKEFAVKNSIYSKCKEVSLIYDKFRGES